MQKKGKDRLRLKVGQKNMMPNTKMANWQRLQFATLTRMFTIIRKVDI